MPSDESGALRDEIAPPQHISPSHDRPIPPAPSRCRTTLPKRPAPIGHFRKSAADQEKPELVSCFEAGQGEVQAVEGGWYGSEIVIGVKGAVHNAELPPGDV
ncbi:hypothetical protein AB0H37_17170 [Actinomadura sp. NPDC023710]|uniref:hypothetical protein n=1 Tax=Actinomadura sp. NPDC023710 TaxID=3158219 RepID=UPI0033EC34E9